MLVSNGVDLRAQLIMWLVDQCVREPIEVIDAEAEVSMWTSILVLDEQITDALKFCEEGLGDGAAGMLGVVDGRVAKLDLGLGMKPVAHAMRARTLASASWPGTMLTLPVRASSRRARASSSHAA